MLFFIILFLTLKWWPNCNCVFSVGFNDLCIFKVG
ncbi:hypothetical protein GLYMA_04G089066v4 [Glycine max]|nr:hypothetical protein GLYMA_04G089066v4 [Glycine max]KAH1110518.1 hypothetical protein GYH30_009384 [Glycine max]